MVAKLQGVKSASQSSMELCYPPLRVSRVLGAANLPPEKVSRDMGYRNDSIAILRDMGPLRLGGVVHQNRASPFASDFYRRRGYRREFRSEDHCYQFSSQKKSRFASGFLRRGNRASWGLKKSRDFSGSGKNRRRNRRESRDFGALRLAGILQSGLV